MRNGRSGRVWRCAVCRWPGPRARPSRVTSESTRGKAWGGRAGRQPTGLRGEITGGEGGGGVMAPKEHEDCGVGGAPPSAAAGLRGAAPAANVLVGEETWRATRGSIKYRDLPPILLKGKQQPV